MTDPRQRSDLALYWRLVREARRYWGHIVVLALLGLVATPLALLTPLPLKLVVDSALGTKPVPPMVDAVLPEAFTGSQDAVLLVAVGLIVLLAIIRQLTKLPAALLGAYTRQKMALEFRTRVLSSLQRQSMAFHDARGIGDSASRIQNDTVAVPQAAMGVIPVITSVFTMVSMLFVSLRIDRDLTLVALAVVPILVVVTQAYRRRLRATNREIRELQSLSLSVLYETLACLRVVKAFGQEGREAARYETASLEGLSAQLKLIRLSNTMGLIVALLTAAGTALVLYVGVRHVQAGVLTLGDLLLLMGYLAQVRGPLTSLSTKLTSLQGQFASADRVFELLDRPPDVPERPNALPLVRAEGLIEFRDLDFAYEPSQPVLQGVSFEVPAGANVGIVGPTGAGKTTLLGLLVRFFDPTGGQILLDGTDLRDYKLADLRNQYALVLQEPVLFKTTIAENIAYGHPEAEMEEIIAAAELASAHAFILGLPEGYETRVGERGMRLSGGERQRISLARAFLRDAPILLLDEPTSAVDLKTEAAIVDAMRELMRGRTTFMAAHRLSTLRHCDTIFQIEDGQLRETTTDAVESAARSIRIGGA